MKRRNARLSLSLPLTLKRNGTIYDDKTIDSLYLYTHALSHTRAHVVVVVVLFCVYVSCIGRDVLSLAAFLSLLLDFE